MAAEAFLYDETTKSIKTGQQLLDALKVGNNYASRFTQTQATAFAEQWEVVDQMPNIKGVSFAFFFEQPCHVAHALN